jgi:hypothetical protein
VRFEPDCKFGAFLGYKVRFDLVMRIKLKEIVGCLYCYVVMLVANCFDSICVFFFDAVSCMIKLSALFYPISVHSFTLSVLAETYLFALPRPHPYILEKLLASFAFPFECYILLLAVSMPENSLSFRPMCLSILFSAHFCLTTQLPHFLVFLLLSIESKQPHIVRWLRLILIALEYISSKFTHPFCTSVYK